MKNVSVTHEVELFKDESTKGSQSVTIDASDSDDVWLSVSHGGNEINLSLKNWGRLVDLVDSAKSKII